MRHSSKTSQREFLPGNLETSYNQLMEDFRNQDLLEEFNLDEEEYSGSKVFVDVEYLGWHEDNSVGEATFRIYPEDSQQVETIRAYGVKRRSVQEILDGKDVVEDQIDNELGSGYGDIGKVSVEAMD